MPQDTEILCESTILCPMLLSAPCTLADSQQEISLDWKTLCQLDSLGPWFPCTIRVAQQASKAGEKTSLESPDKKEGNFSAGIFFVFILTDGDRSQNLPTDNHCHLFYQKGTSEDQIILEREYFKTTVEVTPGAMVSEEKWWPRLQSSSLFSTSLLFRTTQSWIQPWPGWVAVWLDMLPHLPMP